MSNILAGFSIAAIDADADLVLVHLDLGAPDVIEAIDLESALLSGARVAQAVLLERSADNVTWTLSAAAPLGDGLRHRRLAAAPGAAQAARYWRLRLGAGTDGRALTIGQMVFWARDGVTSVHRLLEWVFDDDERFDVLLTHRCADIYDSTNGAWLAACPIPHTQGLIARVDAPQSLDLMLLLHEAVPPHRLFRRADGDWESRPEVFTRMAQYRYEASYANAVNEVQQLRFISFVNGETFSLLCEGYATGSIVFNETNLPALVQAALRALPSVGADGVTCTSAGTGIVNLAFGGRLAASDLAEVTGQSLSADQDGVIVSATLTPGKPGGEDVMSASRGWPACGTFHQGRLVLAGITSLPHAVLFSAIGDVLDFDPGPARADDPMLLSISGDRVARVRRMRSGPVGLEVYTDAGEFRLDGRVVANGQPLAFVQGSERGLAHFLPVHELDGATAFVQAGGQALRLARWTEAQANITSENVSVRAPHMMRRPIGLAAWRASEYAEADLMLVVDADGSISVFLSLHDQKIAGWTPWMFDGRVLACGGQSRGRPLVVVERTMASGTHLRLEALDRTLPTDQSVRLTLDAPTSLLGGLSALDGVQVDVVGPDGTTRGTGIVANGQLTLASPISGAVIVGRRVVPLLETLPWRPAQDEAAGLSYAAQRISEVTLVLGPQCGALQMAANTMARWYSLPEQYLDRGQEGRLARAPRKWSLPGLPGWTRQARVQVRGVNSDPFDVRALVAQGRVA